MSKFEAYTKLESWLLLRELLALDAAGLNFNKAADFLANNEYVQEDPTFDKTRLTPDALHAYFLYLISVEYGTAPALPSSDEYHGKFDEKIPALVKRLYDEYSQGILVAVREDERRLHELAREIREEERKEDEEKKAKSAAEAQQAAARQNTPATDSQPSKPNGRKPSPPQPQAQTPVPAPTPPAKSVPHPPPAQQPQPPATHRPVAPAPVATTGSVQPPTVVAPVPAPTTPAGVKVQPAAKPPNAPGQVLQPPLGVGQPPPRTIQSTSPVPLPAISPRPDTAKPKTPAPVAPAQQATPGTLKWEKPYQPPVVAPHGRPVPPHISPAPHAPIAPGPPAQQQHPGQWQHQPPTPQPGQPQFQAPQPQAPQAQRPTPVLMPPQPAGQLAPPMHAGVGRGLAAPSPQARPASTTPIPAPVVPQVRPVPVQPHPQGPPTPVYQNRPIAAATSTQSPTPAQQAVAPPPPRWPQQQPQAAQYTPSQFTPTPPPPSHTPIQPATADAQRRVGSPYANQPPRPALPPHIASQVPKSPSPAQRSSSAFVPPKTPVATTPTFIRTGSGTKWKPTSTASTPAIRPSQGDIPSPAFEPLSPVQTTAKLSARAPAQTLRKVSPKPALPKPVLSKAELPKSELPKSEQADKATPSKDPKPTRPRGRPPKSAQKEVKEVKDMPESTPSRAGPARRSQSILSHADELSMDDQDELTHHVKDEDATPRPPDETGDTTADESGPSRRRRVTPGSVTSRLAQKRKRQDSPPALPEPLPPASTPTHVLWTRQFGRISSSALDQISSHRCANQFAHPIRERDAPGYKGLVLQPQDIKSIRAAMTHGNRAASDAAKALPDGDPGTPMVWLPINDDLLPPKSIINSEQLERELVHMFSNAIMYNLDPYRGPGASFLKRDDAEDDDDAEPSTYLVDEDAVVRDSRTMFLEVERLLGELRNAERKRSGNPPSASGSARPTSTTATPAGEGTPAAAGHMVDDDLDELAGEEGTVATVKRRRIGTRA